MIEGREEIHRLAREVEDQVHFHFKREYGLEPNIKVSDEIPGTVLIRAEGYEGHCFTVAVTETNQRRLSYGTQ